MKLTFSRTAFQVLPRISLPALRFFTAYARRRLAQEFHALRILHRSTPPRNCARPLVFYLNHASWWDPLVCLMLSRSLFADREAYAPIDAGMLVRYGVFRKLGFFGVEPASARGARVFLRTAQAILASSRHCLWITPQGRFMDVRERPLRLQEGLGALAVRTPEAAFVPVAIEYTFWTEPRPEVLIAFGAPIVPRESPARSPAEWTNIFTEKLEAEQDELADRSCRRDFTEWETLLRGRDGASFIYDLWRRFRAGLRGERFHQEHQPESSR